MTYKIAIDAGHGYNTAGKRTPDGEREWAFNDKVVRAFIDEMSKYLDVEVRRYDDPTGKTDVPLKTRTDLANAWGADIYISFHHNANTGVWGTWTGTETHVYQTKPAGSVRLATLVQAELVKAYGLKDRGLKYTNLHITRETDMDCCLIEGGYMDSVIDIKKLRDNNVLANAGRGVAKAVSQFGGLVLKPVPVPVAPTGPTYTVQAGDTLWGISSKTGVSVANIKAYNGLTDNIIHVGQVLNLSNVKYHTVVSGDTLWGISRIYGVPVDSIKQANTGTDLDPLQIGVKVLIPNG
jgi:N-acetylmuramoyl-L-alanine amidase